MNISDAQTAALFAAPEGPSEDLSGLEQTEAELIRIRALPINEIILEYLGTRDQLDEQRHAYNALEAELKGRMETMSMVMREKADALGVDSFPVRGVGTAYRNKKVSYRMANWEAFVKWIDETKNFHCLEKRVAKLATAEVEKVSGNVPPGVDKTTEVEFLVRRNKA